MKDGEEEMRTAAVRNRKRMTPCAVVEIMSSSNLTQWHGCCCEIPPFTAQGRGKWYARNSCSEYMGLMGKGRKVFSHNTRFTDV